MNVPHTRQTPQVLDIISHSAAQTVRIGQRLGELLRAGDALMLHGDFGAGKTHLTKGIALGLGSDDMVNSPSFVLINEYRAGSALRRMPIFHIDLYRIEDPTALSGIGLEDALAGDGVCVIEWPERAGTWVPAEHLAVYLRHISETKRSLRFEPHGERARELTEALKRAAFS